MSTNKQNYIQSEEINPIQVYKNDTKENENLNNQNKKCDCDFWKPDCCFCSESKCYNCSDYNNYPSINIPNAILFNLISNLAILLIIYLNKNHKNGQKIFWSKKEDKNDIIILYVVFGIEFIFYSPFIFSIPFYESCGSYPSARLYLHALHMFNVFVVFVAVVVYVKILKYFLNLHQNVLDIYIKLDFIFIIYFLFQQ